MLMCDSYKTVARKEKNVAEDTGKEGTKHLLATIG